MYKALILPKAKQDISDAAIWYESKKSGLGLRFTKAVRSKVSFIRQNPESAAVRYDQIRCVVLDVFPYMIHYTVDGEKKAVLIVAIFHTSLNPKKWKKRST